MDKQAKTNSYTKPNVKSNSNFFTTVSIYNHKSCHFEGVSPKNLLLQGWFCITMDSSPSLCSGQNDFFGQSEGA
jgi:hypothetical protein